MSTTAAKPAGTCWRCGGQLYENLVHACTTSVAIPVPAPSDESVYEALRWFARPEAWTITAWGLDGMRLEFNPPPDSPYSTPWGVARDALGGPYAAAPVEADRG